MPGSCVCKCNGGQEGSGCAFASACTASPDSSKNGTDGAYTASTMAPLAEWLICVTCAVCRAHSEDCKSQNFDSTRVSKIEVQGRNGPYGRAL